MRYAGRFDRLQRSQARPEDACVEARDEKSHSVAVGREVVAGRSLFAAALDYGFFDRICI
jgi:hypothetical protein